MNRVILILVACVVGCGSSQSDSPSAAPSTDASAPSDAMPAAATTTVTVFDGEYVHFTGENRREVDVRAALPPSGEQFDRINLSFGLRCPNERCDWWDRVGWLAVVDNPGTEDERVIEIHRFITPYRVGAEWDVDVTDLRPLLSGEVTFRVFIDTWVGPGHANGDGWLVDAAFELRSGTPEREVLAVVPVWSPHAVAVGDPAMPMDERADLELPDGVGSARLRVLVTGHGQGNANNCAEFCANDHTVSIGDARRTRTVWRDDCATTAAPNQAGNWMPSRAGWCPGAKVDAWYEDLPDELTNRASTTVAYLVEDYENTCRPDGPCTDCVFGVCEYNGGSHTAPIYHLSALLVLYR